jgi:hypothetical protein
MLTGDGSAPLHRDVAIAVANRRADLAEVTQ